MQIKLLTLDSSDWNIRDQLRKVSEEHHEVIILGDDIVKNYHDLSYELFDLMQACKTALEILQRGYGDESFIDDAEYLHKQKLKQRHADGKIKLLEDE